MLATSFSAAWLEALLEKEEEDVDVGVNDVENTEVELVDVVEDELELARAVGAENPATNP